MAEILVARYEQAYTETLEQCSTNYALNDCNFIRLAQDMCQASKYQKRKDHKKGLKPKEACVVKTKKEKDGSQAQRSRLFHQSFREVLRSRSKDLGGMKATTVHLAWLERSFRGALQRICFKSRYAPRPPYYLSKSTPAELRARQDAG